MDQQSSQRWVEAFDPGCLQERSILRQYLQSSCVQNNSASESRKIQDTSAWILAILKLSLSHKEDPKNEPTRAFHPSPLNTRYPWFGHSNQNIQPWLWKVRDLSANQTRFSALGWWGCSLCQLDQTSWLTSDQVSLEEQLLVTLTFEVVGHHPQVNSPGSMFSYDFTFEFK